MITFEVHLGDYSLQNENNCNPHEDNNSAWDSDLAVSSDKDDSLIFTAALDVKGPVSNHMLIVLCVHPIKQSEKNQVEKE